MTLRLIVPSAEEPHPHSSSRNPLHGASHDRSQAFLSGGLPAPAACPVPPPTRQSVQAARSLVPPVVFSCWPPLKHHRHNLCALNLNRVAHHPQLLRPRYAGHVTPPVGQSEHPLWKSWV